MKRFCVAIAIALVGLVSTAEAGRTVVRTRGVSRGTSVNVFANGAGGNHGCNRNNGASIQIFAR